MSLSPDVTQTVGKFGSAALFQGMAFNPATTLAAMVPNFCAWWKFNSLPNVSGNRSLVDSINANNFQTATAAWDSSIVPGKFVNGFTLTAAMSSSALSPRINTGTGIYNGIPTGNNPISFALWFKLSTLSQTNNPNCLVSIGRDTAPGEALSVILNVSGGSIGVASTGTTHAYYPTTFDTTTWHHISACWDGSSNLSGVLVYLDGILQTSPSSLSDVALSLATTTSVLDINHRSIDNMGGSYGADCIIDDWRIYDICFTPTQALAVYQGSSDTQ